jgi:hypothetical protein
VPAARVLPAWAALAAVTLVALAVWQGQSYWEYSDGVYSLSARQLLDGRALYEDFAAAQPPPLYLLGAAALAISDTPGAIRAVMALCEAATSLLVLLAVLRLTGSRAAALAAAVACLLTPWALREHAQLLPETVAAPLLLGTALAAGRRGGAIAGGALAALAVALKLAFVIPAAAIVFAHGRTDRRRALASFVATGLLVALACLLAFGASPLWDNIVDGQAQTGRASLHYVTGLWAQAGWNLVALLALAGLAWHRRAALSDPALARTLAAAGLGGVLLLATLVKHGSYLTVLVVAEPPLLCLAAAGLTLAWRERRQRAARPALGIGVAAALALAVAQTASLLASPQDPSLFTRPFAASGPARVLSGEQVRSTVRRIRRCPRGASYPGPPYLAFVAGRRPAGGQPDQFMIAHAPNLERFRQAAGADPAICRGAPVPNPR